MGKESRRRTNVTRANITPNATRAIVPYEIPGAIKVCLWVGFTLYAIALAFLLTLPISKVFPKIDNFVQPVSELFYVEYALFVGFAIVFYSIVKNHNRSYELTAELAGLTVAVVCLYPLSLATFLEKHWMMSIAVNMVLMVVMAGWTDLLTTQPVYAKITIPFMYGWIMAKTAWLLTAFTEDHKNMLYIFALLLIGLAMRTIQHKRLSFLMVAMLVMIGVGQRWDETHQQWNRVFHDVIGLFWDLPQSSINATVADF